MIEGNMEIENSCSEDIDSIISLYKNARDVQKIKNAVLWPVFDKKMIALEVAEKRQWKIVINNQIACVWATTFDDPQIWEKRNSDPSVYIHRIATSPDFRGQNLVLKIVEWAKIHAKENSKKYIRLDTVGENKGLITYYQKCGFDFLGLVALENTTGLPAHYENATVSLFQISLI